MVCCLPFPFFAFFLGGGEKKDRRRGRVSSRVGVFVGENTDRQTRGALLFFHPLAQERPKNSRLPPKRKQKKTEEKKKKKKNTPPPTPHPTHTPKSANHPPHPATASTTLQLSPTNGTGRSSQLPPPFFFFFFSSPCPPLLALALVLVVLPVPPTPPAAACETIRRR